MKIRLHLTKRCKYTYDDAPKMVFPERSSLLYHPRSLYSNVRRVVSDHIDSNEDLFVATFSDYAMYGMQTMYADHLQRQYVKQRIRTSYLKQKLLPRNWDLLKTLIMDASMISVLQNLSRKRITARHSLACGFVR